MKSSANLAISPESQQLPQDYHGALVRLAQDLASVDGNLEKAFRKITECAATQLKIERCSLWLYSENRQSIRCHDLYTSSDGKHSSGAELSARDYPAYFEAIATARIIAAEDAHTDPTTSEFSESYLGPIGINSMLDSPIRLRGKLVGVVCHEHTGPPRPWDLSEQSFAASIGDFTAQAMETSEHLAIKQTLDKAQRIAHVGNWTLNLKNNKWRCSREMARILGYESEEQLADLTSFLDHIHPADQMFARNALHKMGTGIKAYEFKHRMLTTTGVERVISSHIDAVFDESGVPTLLNGASHDITELALMRREEAARRALEEANHALMKSQTALKKTLAALAHEVRTPISSLKLGLGRLLEGAEDARVVGPPLRSEVEYLDALFANLVSLVRIDANTQDMMPTSIDLGALLERLQVRFRFVAEDKGTQIEVALPAEEIRVRGDAVDLEQAIGNLVHNAVKYSSNHVAVLLYLQDGVALIQVRDDGPGFLDAETDQVKERFFRGQIKPSHGRRGMGLGLTIVEEVITQLDGRVRIGNHAEGGGLVEVYLPLL